MFGVENCFVCIEMFAPYFISYVHKKYFHVFYVHIVNCCLSTSEKNPMKNQEMRYIMDVPVVRNATTGSSFLYLSWVTQRLVMFVL